MDNNDESFVFVFESFIFVVLFSMRLPNMLKNIGMVGKGPCAELAVVRPLARMNVHMVLVTELVDESLLKDGSHLNLAGFFNEFVWSRPFPAACSVLSKALVP